MKEIVLYCNKYAASPMFRVLSVNHIPIGEDLGVKDYFPEFGFGSYDDVGIDILSYSLKF